ncbi:MAG TPA: FG-GAP-like repeat-containing protein [Bacteroidales bacterium]|nr:FG-GAP-like repeat-containing protein [Bacteroidales bacterium]
MRNAVFKSILLILSIFVFNQNASCDISGSSIVCNTSYVPGTTMTLIFSINIASPQSEFGDYLEITFPAGITPTGLNTSDSICDSYYGQDPEYLNGVNGHVISWGDDDNYFGGIILGTHLFHVEVIVANGLKGVQLASFHLSGDEYFGMPPHELNGNIEIQSICSDPSNLQVANVGPASSEIRWNSTSGCSNWDIQYDTTGFVLGTANILNVTTNPFIIMDLDPLTDYDVYVRDSCGNGITSSWIGPYTFTTSVCNEPANLTASSITYTSANLNWTSVNALHWDISYAISSETNPENGTIIYDGSKPCSLTGLESATTYKFWVRDTCYHGMHSDWVEQSFTTATVIPPSNLSYSNLGPTSVQLNWTNGSCPNYDLQYGLSGFEFGTGNIIHINTNPYTIIGLSPQNTYDIYMRDSCGINATSNWVGPISVTTSDLFTVIDIDTLPDINGTLSWVNLDNDSDLDALAYGSVIDGWMSYDLTGSCEYHASGLYGSYNYAPRGSFIDYNGDNYVDLLDFGDEIIHLNNQDFTFTSSFGEWNNFNVASTSFADYDADGDVDIFVTGTYLQTGLPGYTTILINDDAGNFSDAGIDFLGLKDGVIKTTDFNNDGYVDFINTGVDINNNVNTILYKGDGNGNFKIVQAGIIKLKMGTIDWGDYNNDGLIDLIIAGRTAYSTEYKIYKNLGNDQFEDIGLELDNSLEYTHFQWADLNNDGYLDIVATGKQNISDYYSNIFFNNKDDSFTQYNIPYGSISLGDYDNDGDLDILRSFGDNSYGNTDVYINNTQTSNLCPSVPFNLNSNVLSNYVELSWDKANDDLTNSDGLTYNLRIGTSSNSSDIISPLSNLSTGTSKYFKHGNKLHVNSCTIKDLDVGDYYWSVQAIDNAGNASAFSAEQTFTVLPFFEVKDILFQYDGWQKMKWCKGLSSENSLDIMSIGIKNIYVGSPFPMPKPNSNTVLTSQAGDDFVSGFFDPLENISYGDFDFADANSDGKIDILLTGAIYDYHGGIEGDSISKLYTVDYLSGAIDQEVDIPFLKYSSVDWGDYNNDGKIDFIISGKSGNDDITKVYKNIGNLDFEEEISVNIQGVSNGTCRWVDLNNDGYLDLFTCGELNGAPKTLIYKNNTLGGFELQLCSIENLSSSSVDFGDYDADGDLDILIAGSDIDKNSFTSVYKNLGDFCFEEQELNIRKVFPGNVKWLDYDNDGLLDISIIGRSGLPLLAIYKNHGDNVFSEFETNIDPSWFNSAAWFDYDSDGDLDVALGKEIFKNNNNWSNNKPSSPTDLTSQRYGYGVKLEWEPAGDDNTDAKSLSYNIRIGTQLNGFDVINPMSNVSSGDVSVSELGNCQLNTKYYLDSLPEGTYYWSVQSIDQGFKGSNWAPEQTFKITVIRADFVADSACKGVSTHFTDISLTGGTEITDWEWDFGDGSTSTLQHPTHTYATAGTFDVQLVAISSEYSDTITKQVIVKPRPITNFTTDLVCQGTATSFINATDHNTLAIESWQWNFGDGSISNAEQPGSHGYLNTGEYNASLIAVADNGCSDTATHIVTVAGYPASSISVDGPLSFCSGDSVSLSVESDSMYNYQWLLNGANITGADSSIFKALGAGQYSARITNTTGNCITVSDEATVNVAGSPASPTITAAGSTTFCSSDSVILSVTDNPDYSYKWKLNGGSVGSNSNNYTAKSSGAYSLDVTNSAGCSNTSSNTILVTVLPVPTMPTVNMSGSTTFCDGQSVNLSVTGNPAMEYQWKNGEITIEGATNSNYLAEASGDYKLKITNTKGCAVETTPVEVQVYPNPVKPVVAEINGNTNFCPGTEVTLEVTNAGQQYTFQWKRSGIPIPGADQSRYSGKLTAGEYSVVVSREICSDESEPLTLTTLPAPEKPEIIAKGPNIWYLACSNDSATAYKWYRNSTEITGVNDYIFVAGDQTGKYEVAISVNGSCFSMSDPVYVPLGTGIEESPFSNLKIYPNPTPGLFTLEMDNPVMGELIIDIFGETGKKVINIKFRKETSRFMTQIDLSEQPAAVYLISLALDEWVTTRRLVVE